MKLLQRRTVSWVCLSIAVLALAGCGQHADDDGAAPVSVDADSGEHGGWWCPEHGIPEEVCSLCSSKAADKFKAQGDWCDEHNRAESQCFKCDPSRGKEKFAKLYAAKFGHEPPKPTD